MGEVEGALEMEQFRRLVVLQIEEQVEEGLDLLPQVVVVLGDV
jgi:hypothetical protein